MRLLIQKLANSKAVVAGLVRIGEDSFYLLRQDKSIKGVLNGSDIFCYPIRNDNIEKIGCFLGKFLIFLGDKRSTSSIPIDRSCWKDKQANSESILNVALSKISPEYKVISANSPEEKDIFNEKSSSIEVSDYEAIFKNIGIFSRKIANAYVALSNAVKNSNIISGRTLINSMWGAPATQKYLNNKNASVTDLSNKLDTAGMHQELIQRSVKRVQASIKEKKLPSDTRKVLAQILIPNIVSSYEDFKKIASEVMLETSPLLYVDDVFKKNTGYPANWFISEEILNNLDEDIKHIFSFVYDIPAIENKAVIPLDSIGTQIFK